MCIRSSFQPELGVLTVLSRLVLFLSFSAHSHWQNENGREGLELASLRRASTFENGFGRFANNAGNPNSTSSRDIVCETGKTSRELHSCTRSQGIARKKINSRARALAFQRDSLPFSSCRRLQPQGDVKSAGAAGDPRVAVWVICWHRKDSTMFQNAGRFVECELLNIRMPSKGILKRLSPHTTDKSIW